MEIILVGQNLCGYIYIVIWENKKSISYKIKNCIRNKKNQDFLMRFFFINFFIYAWQTVSVDTMLWLPHKKIIICHYEITQIYMN